MIESVNATSAFLGDESRWSGVRVSLDDVQALWGGFRVQAAGDGVVIVTIVDRGGLEQKRTSILDHIRWRELILLLIEFDAVAIDRPQRPGLPDETFRRLTLVNADERVVSVSKWAGVRDERFDSVYVAMRALGAPLPR